MVSARLPLKLLLPASTRAAVSKKCASIRSDGTIGVPRKHGLRERIVLLLHIPIGWHDR